MAASPPLARVASVIGDPVRALMLSALMDGRSRTAGELARAGGVTPQTASTHLARMTAAGLLVINKQGRHHYHRLASAEVAHALEALMALSATSARPPQPGPRDQALRHARSCYDHLAGKLAVQLTDGWIARDWIRVHAGVRWELSDEGRLGLASLGIELPDPALRRPPLRPCLDWSERKPHLGGQLGAILLDTLLARDLVRRRPGSRALLVTGEGERVLRQWSSRPAVRTRA